MKTVSRICPQCGKQFQIAASDHRVKQGKTIFCSRKCSAESMKTGAMISCSICGREFYSTRRKTCSVDCGRKLKEQHREHHTYIEGGYVVEYRRGYNKKGNMKQHRRIMEEFIGRPLAKDEVVHHKNGIKTDNRIENLEILNRSEHSSMHRKMEKENGKHLFGGYHNN